MKIEWKYFGEEVLKGVELVRAITAVKPKNPMKERYDAYIVGGCVRDIIRWYTGKVGSPNIHDVDICTNMPMDELYEVFNCTSNNGEAHGTILVKYEGIAFEVTQFRTEADYSDGRHPDRVEWADTFKEDSERRDFTINAMAIDADGNVIDYHGGLKDLRDGVLRTVGNPEERFGEDALRIIRAMRFAARFNMSVDPATLKAITKLHGTLSKIAVERISSELKKTAEYGMKQFAQVLDLIVSTGTSESIDPQGLINWSLANKLASNRAIDSLVPELDRDVSTAMTLMMAGCKDIKKFTQEFRLETDLAKTATYVYGSFDTFKNFGDNLTDSIKMVNNKDFDRLREIAYVCDLGQLDNNDLIAIENLIDTALPKLKILNKAVIDAGFTGAEIGKKLKPLTEWFYEQCLNGREPMIEEIMSQLQ